MGPPGSILDALKSTRTVGIDTPVFIYHIEQATPLAPVAGEVLRSVANGDFAGVTSIITLLEVTVRPLRLGRPEIAAAYEMLIRDIPNLAVVDLDTRVARASADLRARYGLRTPDALQIAACLVHGGDTFITNDRRLRSVTEIDVRVLVDFA